LAGGSLAGLLRSSAEADEMMGISSERELSADFADVLNGKPTIL